LREFLTFIIVRLVTGQETLNAFFKRHPGVTRAALAEALKVSRTVVYYWQTGRVVPALQRRKDIAAFTRDEVPEECWGATATESEVEPFVEPPDGEAPTDPAPAREPLASTGTTGTER
jgi:DNA-binding XRE family transcriptional regulator